MSCLVQNSEAKGKKTKHQMLMRSFVLFVNIWGYHLAEASFHPTYTIDININIEHHNSINDRHSNSVVTNLSNSSLSIPTP